MPTIRFSATLFEELAAFFASAPNQQAILDFRPSQTAMDRASELLERNRQNQLSEEACEELNQFEQAEHLMRMIKARIRASEAAKKSAR